jgi:hypothetical protein
MTSEKTEADSSAALRNDKQGSLRNDKQGSLRCGMTRDRGVLGSLFYFVLVPVESNV